jgi:hypothetical protein
MTLLGFFRGSSLKSKIGLLYRIYGGGSKKAEEKLSCKKETCGSCL